MVRGAFPYVNPIWPLSKYEFRRNRSWPHPDTVSYALRPLRLCDPCNSARFFPVILTPADLWYHSRFPRYWHLTVFVTQHEDVHEQELGILVVGFNFISNLFSPLNFWKAKIQRYDMFYLVGVGRRRETAVDARRGKRNRSYKPKRVSDLLLYAVGVELSDARD